MLLEARVAVVTTRKKTFQLRFFGRSSKEVWKTYEISKKNPRKLPRIRRLRVPQIYRIFLLKVNTRSETEKKIQFFSFENVFQNCVPSGHLLLFCQPWKMFSAIVPKTSKIIRKSPSFHDFLSEMLLRKCFSGHVKSSFDNPAKNFPVKIQVFLVKVQKKTENQLFTSIFWSFFSVHLDYCFDTPEYFFAKIRKKFTQSSEKDDNSINYFYHFFLKVLLRIREMHF